MRFSPILYKQHLGWHFKKIWETQSPRKILNLILSPYLQKLMDERKTMIVDPTIKELKKLPHFVSVDPRFRKKPTGKDDPLYKERICLIGSENTQLLEGQKHAMILTKTILKPGLPKPLQDLSTEYVKDQDRIHEAIMQALVWDPTQDKLPKKIDPLKTYWIFKREFGIPWARQNQILCFNFLRLCESLAFKYPRVLSRQILTDTVVSVPYEKDEHLIQLRYAAPYFLTTNRPLSPFASKDEVAASKDELVPDIYPLHYIIDLEESQFYNIEDYYVVSEGYNSAFPHTLFITHHAEGEFSEDQFHGKAILGCFSYTTALARMKYGKNVKILPAPISIQCVQLIRGKTFHFYAYQLNSMDMTTENGIKNLFWLDPAYNLHGGLDEEKNLLDYNPEVFKKILTFYLNEAA